MKSLNLFNKLSLVLACAALAMTTVPAEARLIKAHAGTTFTPLAPIEFDAQGNPTKFSHSVDGIVRVSSLGNCTVHFDVIAVPRPDGTFGLIGTMQIITADGQTTLNADVEGATSPDPDSSLMANLHYDVKFTGGTGQMINARGRGDIDGFLLFNEGFAGGKATWLLNGQVFVHGKGQKD